MSHLTASSLGAPGRGGGWMLRMFYFSGTGNARNVARWMVEAWRERHEGAEAVDLAG